LSTAGDRDLLLELFSGLLITLAFPVSTSRQGALAGVQHQHVRHAVSLHQMAIYLRKASLVVTKTSSA
jgi:hypothetical protein